MNNVAYARIYQMEFWAAYWITMRPYLLFVSGAAGLVGLSFTNGLTAPRIFAAALPLFFSYGFGQALTDCFQTDTDSLSSPYRPLVRGIVSRTQVAVSSLLGLLFVVLILMRLNPEILIPGALGVLGLLTYTWLKRTWWGGPPWNSWIVALLPVMGRLAEANSHISTLFNFKNPQLIHFLLALVAVFAGYANFVVMGYFKDISADRVTGYRTFPVVFGWIPTAIYSDVVALIAASASLGCLMTIAGPSIWGFAVFLCALAINMHAQVRIHITRSETESHGPIANVVRAFVLYCLAIVLASKSGWWPILAVYYGLFEVTLRHRPEQSQV
jgi:4-hydroxybenzoate polyprenyltransferase